jgi:hypothetical protein
MTLGNMRELGVQNLVAYLPERRLSTYCIDRRVELYG